MVRFILTAILFVSLSGAVQSQEYVPSKSSTKAPSSTSFAVHLPDFQDFIQRFESTPFLKDTSLIHHFKAVEEIDKEAWDECQTLLSRIRSLNFYSDWRTGDYILCIDFLAGRSAYDLTRHAMNSSAAAQLEPPSETEVIWKSTDSLWGFVGKGEECVFSNSEVFLAKYVNGEADQKGLARDRRYGKAMAAWSDHADASIYVYVRPDEVDGFFSVASEEQLKMAKVGEINTASYAVTVNGSGRLVVDSRLYNTFPESGAAAVWRAEKPVELDFRFPFEVLRLKSVARNIEEDYAARQENHDRIKGRGDYVAMQNRRFPPYDFRSEILPRADSRHFIIYRSKSRLEKSFTLEPVKDYKCMLRYLEARVSSRNDKGEVCVRKPALETNAGVDCIIFGVSGVEQEKNSKNRRASIDSNVRVREYYERLFQETNTGQFSGFEDYLEELESEDDGFVLSKNWLISGDVVDGIEFLRQLNANDPCKSWDDLRRDLNGVVKLFSAQPTKIVYDGKGLEDLADALQSALKGRLKAKYGRGFGDAYVRSMAMLFDTGKKNDNNDGVHFDEAEMLGLAIVHSLRNSYEKKYKVRVKNTGEFQMSKTIYFCRELTK